MATKQELIETIETIAVASNEGTMNQIKESEQDISTGRVKEINSVDDL